MRIIISIHILIAFFLAFSVVRASGVFYHDQNQFVYKAGVEFNNVTQFLLNFKEGQDLNIVAGEEITFEVRDEFGVNNAANLRNLTFKKEGIEVQGDVFGYDIKLANGHLESESRVIDLIFDGVASVFGLSIKNQQNAESSRLYNDDGALYASSTNNGLPVTLKTNGDFVLAQGGVLSVEGTTLGFDQLALKRNVGNLDVMFNNNLTDIEFQGNGIRLYSNTAPTANDHLVTKGYVEAKGYLTEFPEPPLPVNYNLITGTQKNFEMSQHAHRAKYQYVAQSWTGLPNNACRTISCPAGMVIVQGSGSRDSADCDWPGRYGCDDNRVTNVPFNSSSMEVCSVGDVGSNNDEISAWIFCAGIGPLIGGQNVLN